jgi:predicted ribosome quality control (RQC) complex YloA/Tae2 family protein
LPTALDLDRAARTIAPLIRDHVITGAAITSEHLDLVLFLAEPPLPDLPALRIATGPPQRARVGLESVRLPREAWASSELATILEKTVATGRLRDVRCLPGERRLDLDLFAAGGGVCRLVVEMFGPLGNWFLLAADGTILAQARQPRGSRADLKPGMAYRPPEAKGSVSSEPSVPHTGSGIDWLCQQAAFFATVDAGLRRESLTGDLTAIIGRERKGVANRVRGLEERHAAQAQIGPLRREGELLLALPDGGRRGRSEITVQDWYDEGRPRLVALDPRLSLHENAEQRFDRARRLEEGATHTLAQLEAARARAAQIEALATRLTEAVERADDAALTAVQVEVGGLVRRRPSPSRRRPERRRPYLAFVSSEGYPIWIGRTSEDNDRLTLALARGNDVWLHAAGGMAGSHVVVRLERGKTASLETLLDAATLALHFSKARGRPAGEVIYTPRKNVRKPKGWPKGQVEVLRSKTLHVRVEADRLRRLLASGGDSP